MGYSENMPILYRNIMDGLPSAFAREVFLWAAERSPVDDRSLYIAEDFAHEANTLTKALNPMLEFSAKQHDCGDVCVLADLEKFTLKRHANYRFCGNVNPAYAAYDEQLRAKSGDSGKPSENGDDDV